jgi:hypothetical protein
MKVQTKADELRGKSVAASASCAVLAVVPAVTMTHGLVWVGCVSIGVQVVLLVVAIRYLTESRKARAIETQ